eukprot:751064-Prorocentrum_minimum.AAC.1
MTSYFKDMLLQNTNYTLLPAVEPGAPRGMSETTPSQKLARGSVGEQQGVSRGSAGGQYGVSRGSVGGQ